MSEPRAPTPTSASAAELLAWQRRLIGADSPAAVGAVILALAASLPGCEKASLLWRDGATPTQGAAVTPGDVVWAREGLADHGFCLSDDRRRVVWRLLSGQPIALLLQFASGQQEHALRMVLESHFALASHHLLHELELAGLRESHQQVERSEKLQHALFSIADLAGSELDMSDMLRGIQGIVGTLLYAENFFLLRYDPERDTVRFLYYADTENDERMEDAGETPLEFWNGTRTWHLLTTGKALMGRNESLHALVEAPLRILGPEYAYWVGVPMLRDGQARGALVVQSYLKDTIYTTQDRVLLEFVASHILTALERRQGRDALEQQVRRRTQELVEANVAMQGEVVERQRAEALQTVLFQLAQLATAEIDEDSFYEQVHVVVGRLLNAENFFIALISEDCQHLDFPYYVDTETRGMPSRPIGHGLSEYVLRTATPLLLRQQSEIDALSGQGVVVPQHVGQPATCWLGVPLLVGDEVIGLVTVQSLVDTVSYNEADRELLSFAASQIANSIRRRRSAASLQQAKMQLEQRVEERTQELRTLIAERERVQEQLRHQVMHDALTGLPNRGYLCDRVDHLLGVLKRKPERRCALLYLDIDHFKSINDSFGHLAGDEFLKMISGRLQLCVRDPDLVARLSGDEFAIVLEDIEAPASAVNVAQRVLKALHEPLQTAGEVLEPSVSIGIAIGDHRYGSSDELLHAADTALYRAKASGRHRFEMFDQVHAPGLDDGRASASEVPE
ncbi:MAG: diguanylate cyclase [Rhodanobacter sp.]|nr:diguanylate cyclase [Rhodanobacter sp.]